MRRLAIVVLCAAFVGGAPPRSAAGEAPGACAVLTEDDALALVGGPLGEVFRNETPASAENGHDHTTVCGFFPKGYDVRRADGPPPRGLLLTLHAMRSPDDARTFHEMTSETPTPGATKVLTGIGDAAQVDEGTAGGDRVANLSFLKGAVSGRITAWRQGGDVVAIATDAAKRAAAKLP